MSGSTALVDAELVDARRFCGYPAYGSGPNDDTFNRFFAEYYTLEYRLANLDPAELVVTRAKLAELNTLDSAVATAGARLSTDQAAVWYRNKTEVRDRQDLYKQRCRELCGFLGIPPGPFLATSDGNNIRMVI